VSQDITLSEGDKAIFTCNATNDIDSDHPLGFYWYSPTGALLKTQRHIFIYNTTNLISKQIQSVLLIDQINDTDAGVYTCRAFNHPKLYTESMIDLSVECK